MAAAGNLPGTKLPANPAPAVLRLASMLLRAVFIISLIALTFRVSLPQSETILTAYDTPGDMIRVVLGFFLCLWLAVQLFRPPHDAASYRTWLYLGLAAVPFAAICLYETW